MLNCSPFSAQALQAGIFLGVSCFLLTLFFLFGFSFFIAVLRLGWMRRDSLCFIFCLVSVILLLVRYFMGHLISFGIDFCQEPIF